MEELTRKTTEFFSPGEEESVGRMTKVESSFFRNMKKVIASRSKSDSAPAKDSAAPRLSVSSLPSVSATPKLVPKSRSVNFSRQSSRESGGAHAQEARRSSKEEAEEGGQRNGGGEHWDQDPGTADTLHQVQHHLLVFWRMSASIIMSNTHSCPPCCRRWRG